MTEQMQSTESQSHNSQEQATQQPENNNFFQAIGVISGEVNIMGNLLSTITIQGREYKLRCQHQNQQLFTALKYRIKNTGNSFQTLMVYPKVTHFPRRQQPHIIDFELVNYRSEDCDKGIFSECQDLEFKLFGLWQFIRGTETPCISIFKNLNQERLEYIKSVDSQQRVKFMKPAHLPVIWHDPVVCPCRFNPKLPKQEQGKRYFVQVKAKFSPQENVFHFESILGLPSENAPRFLSAQKRDKAKVIKQKRQQRKNAQAQSDNPMPKPKNKTA
ncbi:MAG TPA: hypothetical protein V6D25_14390 [Leptolyngbyaceae cyanobacterium]